MNREWVIDNMAQIITKQALRDDKDNFLMNVYQEAVNAQAVEN